MTQQEKVKRLAKEVMGWHKARGVSGWWFHINSKPKAHSYGAREAWNPCEYIADAWMIVEKLIQKYVFTLAYDDVGECWACTIFGGQQGFTGHGSVQEAICEATLRTLEEVK